MQDKTLPETVQFCEVGVIVAPTGALSDAITLVADCVPVSVTVSVYVV